LALLTCCYIKAYMKLPKFETPCRPNRRNSRAYQKESARPSRKLK
jgi:hypothetical protein